MKEIFHIKYKRIILVISSLIISFFALLIYFNNKNLVVTNHVKIALLDSGLSKKNYSEAIIISSGKSTDAHADVMLKAMLIEQLALELWDYVHWFNNLRIHGTLGYLTPVEFKQQPL